MPDWLLLMVAEWIVWSRVLLLLLELLLFSIIWLRRLWNVMLKDFFSLRRESLRVSILVQYRERLNLLKRLYLSLRMLLDTVPMT